MFSGCLATQALACGSHSFWSPVSQSLCHASPSKLPVPSTSFLLNLLWLWASSITLMALNSWFCASSITAQSIVNCLDILNSLKPENIYRCEVRQAHMVNRAIINKHLAQDGRVADRLFLQSDHR